MRLLLFYRRYTYCVSLYLIHVSLLSSPFFPSPPLFIFTSVHTEELRRESSTVKKKKRKIKKKSSSTATDIFFFPLSFSFLSMQSGIVPRLVAIKMFMRSVKGSPLLEGKTRRIWTGRRTREKAKSVEISVKIGN